MQHPNVRRNIAEETPNLDCAIEHCRRQVVYIFRFESPGLRRAIQCDSRVRGRCRTQLTEEAKAPDRSLQGLTVGASQLIWADEVRTMAP